MSGKRRALRPLIGLLAAFVLLIALWPNASSLYDLTGEEALPAQLRGVVHWMYTAIRPQPDLASGAQITHAELRPFGMNTFLQQEVLPEVREQSLNMLKEAGFGNVIVKELPHDFQNYYYIARK